MLPQDEPKREYLSKGRGVNHENICRKGVPGKGNGKDKERHQNKNELVCLKESKISAAVAGRYGWDQIILASEKVFNVTQENNNVI